MSDFFQKVKDSGGVPTFFWEVTPRCNQHCSMCYLPEDRGGEELPLALVPRLTQELRALRCLIVTLSGGEPFLRPDILDIVRVFRESGLAVVIFSNGTIMEAHHLDCLAELGLLRLEISVFSLRPEVASAMGCLDISRVIDCVESARRRGIAVTVKTPVTKQNVDDLAMIAAWCRRISAEHQPDPLIQSKEDGQRHADLLLPPRQVAEITGSVISACDVGPGTMAMRWDGVLFPCLTIPRPMGKWPEQTLQEVVTSREASAMWSLVKRTEMPCKSCPHYRQCPRCPGLFLSEANGKPWDYLCRVAQSVTGKRRAE